MKLNFVAGLSLAAIVSASPLVPRGQPTCKNLKADANNGGRKIGIVIDSSGSMYDTDPYNLRILAGEQINDWLVTSKEASGSKKEDLVTVVDFDDVATLLYPLGDPSGAEDTFKLIDSMGGTYIAGGVDMATNELTKAGHDPTSNRSGIVVLTDGSDSDTATLIDSINKCGQLGVRVSFGFLTYDASYQDPEVLTAILGTGGMYATIDGATAQNSFVNLMIVHGLTGNDNPSSNSASTLVNGLSIASVMDSSGSNTLTYTAEAKEKLTFQITSVNAGDLTATANDANGKTLGTASISSYGYPEDLVVTAASDGDLQLKITGDSGQKGALFIVGVNSSIPIQNCTLASVRSSGFSKGAKAGIGIAVPLLVGLLGAGSFFLWKYWKSIPGIGSSGAAPPAYTPNNPPMTDPSSYKQPMVQTSSYPSYQNYPNQADPSQQHPNHMDPYHSNETDPNNVPPQTDPSHPNQSDPSHPNQLDPSHPNQLDPSHPNQADTPPNHSNTDPSQHHPNQADPPPNQNGTDPSTQPTNNPPHHPHKPPRFRLFSRRRRNSNEHQHQPPQSTPPQFNYYNNTVQSGAPSPIASPSQPYIPPAQGPQYQVHFQQQQYFQHVAVPQPYSPVGSLPPLQQQYASPVQGYAAPVYVPALGPPQPQHYNVSPVLSQAELASPAPVSPAIHRRPVGGGEGQ